MSKILSLCWIVLFSLSGYLFCTDTEWFWLEGKAEFTEVQKEMIQAIENEQYRKEFHAFSKDGKTWLIESSFDSKAHWKKQRKMIGLED